MKIRTKYSLKSLAKNTGDLTDRRLRLIKNLGTALKLEHGTIPPYLYALYSIKDPWKENIESSKVLLSVAKEEMLHMVLVANLLNAIQNTAIDSSVHSQLYLDKPDFMMDYPDFLPIGDNSFKVGLLPFSEEAIETFLKIERPAEADEPAINEKYQTIGQFYAAIKQEFEEICEDFSEDEVFIGDLKRQVTPEYYYSGGGEVIVVNDLKSAKLAIKTIVDEGEGFSGSIFSGDNETFGEVKDLAHYFKFNQILVGRYYTSGGKSDSTPQGGKFHRSFGQDSVYPSRHNPIAKYDLDILEKVKECDKTYWDILRACQNAFNGEKEKLKVAVYLMHELRNKMVGVMRIPVPGKNYNASPTFKYQN